MTGSDEALITINGQTLNYGQSLVIRRAIAALTRATESPARDYAGQFQRDTLSEITTFLNLNNPFVHARETTPAASS